MLDFVTGEALQVYILLVVLVNAWLSWRAHRRFQAYQAWVRARISEIARGQ